ncbi:MAG: hypothetical protein GXC73_02905 [Chitinophagaceae bacterium]|nr:hypothetical protein [Chitinophagaceae bacterium]
MKSYHLFLMTGLMLLSACAKQSVKGQFKAKLIDSFCVFNIVQIENAKGSVKGMNWTNSAGTQYKNVFTVQNFCDFNAAGIQEGETFTAELIEDATNQACAVCYGYMETPPLQLSIRVIQ